MSHIECVSRRSLLRGTSLAALSGVLAPVIPGIAQAQASHALVPVRFTCAANLSLANIFVAEGSGLFRKHGIDPKIIMFDVGFLGTEAVLAGMAETAVTVEFPLINYVARGGDLVVLAVTLTADDMKIVALNSIRKPNDLLGKRVAYTVGSQLHYGFDQYMLKQGLPRDQIKIVDVPAAEQIALLAKGDIDALVNVEPMVTRSLDLMRGKAHVLSPGIETAAKTRAYLQVKRSWAESNPRIASSMLAALVEAEAFMKRSPSEAAEFVARRLKLPPAQVVQMLEKTAGDWRPQLDGSLPNVFGQVTDWMRANKRLGAEPPNLKNVLAPVYLNAVAPGNVAGL